MKMKNLSNFWLCFGNSNSEFTSHPPYIAFLGKIRDGVSMGLTPLGSSRVFHTQVMDL